MLLDLKQCMNFGVINSISSSETMDGVVPSVCARMRTLAVGIAIYYPKGHTRMVSLLLIIFINNLYNIPLLFLCHAYIQWER